MKRKPSTKILLTPSQRLRHPQEHFESSISDLPGDLVTEAHRELF
jgi:hypothetical protein